MQSFKTLKISTLLLIALMLFNSCGVSIDVAKRYHQPGFYVNINHNWHSPEDKAFEDELEEVETEGLTTAQLPDQKDAPENIEAPSDKQASATGKTKQQADPEDKETSKTTANNIPVFAGSGGMLQPGNFFSKSVDADVVQTGGSGGKSQTIALILGLVSLFVLVGFGLHRFYLGYTRIAIWQIVLTVLGVALAFILVGFVLLAIVWVWTLIDVIRIITGDLQPKDGSYSSTF